MTLPPVPEGRLRRYRVVIRVVEDHNVYVDASSVADAKRKAAATQVYGRGIVRITAREARRAR